MTKKFVIDEEKIAAYFNRNPSLVNLKNKDGDYPIHSAAKQGITSIGLESTKYIMIFSIGLFQMISSEGNEKLVKILIRHGADVNSKGQHFCSALHLAAIKGECLISFRFQATP